MGVNGVEKPMWTGRSPYREILVDKIKSVNMLNSGASMMYMINIIRDSHIEFIVTEFNVNEITIEYEHYGYNLCE